MYLSRLRLDARSRVAREWLGDCHALHRAIMSGFPATASEAARAELGVLFRVEAPSQVRGGPGDDVRIIVQSSVEPAWAFETAQVRVDPPRSLAPLEEGFRAGAVYAFRLRANPTRRVAQRATRELDSRRLTVDGYWKEAEQVPEAEWTGVTRRAQVEKSESSGKRVELTREEDQLAWLQRKGREHCGFRLLTSSVTAGSADAGSRTFVRTRSDPAPRLGGFGRMDRRLTFGTVLFEGRLAIVDPAAFRAAFDGGVGPAKAFGCGLLSLQPIDTM